jgi:hypothetical protein
MTAGDERSIRDTVAEMALRIRDIEDRVTRADADRADMVQMLRELHDALMKPQPGHEKPLLQRMAAVTIASETGKAAGERVIWAAKVIAAGGAIASGLYAAFRFGHPPQ